MYGKNRQAAKETDMTEAFDIQSYMTHGVERVVSDAVKATLKNPRQSAFMAKFAMASRKASEKRAKFREKGENIPPFLIGSITSRCNLHCAGCYSRRSLATNDAAPVRQLSDGEWETIFEEADDLGISFILLAGGEPLLRRGVIEAAGKVRNIAFPIFTNGTFMDERYFELFDRCRNLIPVLSIEGSRSVTDERRGAGVYERQTANMDELQRRGVFYGTSVTVTSENLREVVSEEFVRDLAGRGCKLAVLVEFVPVTEESTHLALSDEEREFLQGEITRLRKEHPEMVFISFPGDEKSSGGCVAAGRGFFHINSHGGAEPCPFSPYSDTNVREKTLREAMNSPLFRELRDGGYLMGDHEGGCVLYEKRAQVEALLAGHQ